MKFGIYTLIIENKLKKSMIELGLPKRFTEYGWGNGYVLLPYNHPFYEKDCYGINVNIHGGLTFGQLFRSEYFLEWVKDLEIGGDVNRDNFEKFDSYWIIGFDTSHYEDSEYNCPKEYVISESISLMEQCLDDNIDGIERYKSLYFRGDKLKRINEVKGLNDD